MITNAVEANEQEQRLLALADFLVVMDLEHLRDRSRDMKKVGLADGRSALVEDIATAAIEFRDKLIAIHPTFADMACEAAGV